MTDLDALYQRELQAKAESLALVLPAFKELYFTPEQLGISGGDQDVKMELAQYLEDIFTDKHSLTITVQQEVFIALGKRIKELVEAMQGGTWVQPEVTK